MTSYVAVKRAEISYYEKVTPNTEDFVIREISK